MLRKLNPYRAPEPEPELPAGSAPAPGAEIHGNCPVCESALTCSAGAIRGGEPSGKFQDLQARAESAEEWRQRARALELEHTSRDISDPPAVVPPAAPRPGEVLPNRYFI
jgi:hypothetical protein